MNFSDFGKYNQFKEQFANMSPEMKEQMMKMAKEQMKARVGGFFKKWFSLPVLTIVAAGMGAAIGALMAFFGQVLLTVGGLRDAHPIYLFRVWLWLASPSFSPTRNGARAQNGAWA